MTTHPDAALFAECEGHRRCECAGCVAYSEQREMARVCQAIRDKASGKPAPRVDHIDYESHSLFGLLKKAFPMPHRDPQRVALERKMFRGPCAILPACSAPLTTTPTLNASAMHK